MYATVALLVTSVPVIIQGLTFVVYMKWLNQYKRNQKMYEVAERLRATDQLGLMVNTYESSGI